jgi:hypothetical protein
MAYKSVTDSTTQSVDFSRSSDKQIEHSLDSVKLPQTEQGPKEADAFSIAVARAVAFAGFSTNKYRAIFSAERKPNPGKDFSPWTRSS